MLFTKTGFRIVSAIALSLGILGASSAMAETEADRHLEKCLKQAEASPDDAFVAADSWARQGGGDKARLCRAFAQFHRGEYSLAGQEFSSLGAARDTKDKKHALSLHTQAALSFMRANNHRRAEAEYDAALALEQQDPDIWMDRATERAANEKYWEALDDLKKALEIMPDMAEAIKLRAQIWKKLGLNSKARSDFEQSTLIEQGQVQGTQRAP